MKVSRRLWSLACAGALILTIPAVSGCGPSTPDAKTANVQAGDMPPGGDWTGVWYSELYGYLHLVQDGNAISGKWLRTHKEKSGELHGQATGDLIRFEWTEYECGRVGPGSTHDGRGYFKYKKADEGLDDSITGETGRGMDEVGDPWEAIKQRNVKPDLVATSCGTGSGDIGGGDFDGENKEEGKPEAPKPPPAP